MQNAAIVTTTYYPENSGSSKIRAGLALYLFEKACKSEYEVITIDGGSFSDFLDRAKALGAKIIPQKENGIGGARRQAFKEGYSTGKEIIIWTEPEKHDLIRSIPKIINPLLGKRADLVIPSRRALGSYPSAQQFIEPFCNLFWKELTGKEFDMWFGPRAMLRESALLFINYKSNYGDKWDNLHMPVMDAIKWGKKVIGLEIDYIHDKEQRDNEEHSLEFYKKRIEQLNNLLPAFEEYWNRNPTIEIS